ncbi:hypothetical protein EJB05_15198, partial [Eragrostis curvula]
MLTAGDLPPLVKSPPPSPPPVRLPAVPSAGLGTAPTGGLAGVGVDPGPIHAAAWIATRARTNFPSRAKVHLGKACIGPAHSRSTPIGVGIQQLHRRPGTVGSSLALALSVPSDGDGDGALLLTGLTHGDGGDGASPSDDTLFLFSLVWPEGPP